MKMLGDRIDPEYFGYNSSWCCNYTEIEDVEAMLEDCGFQKKPRKQVYKIRKRFTKEVSASSLSVLGDMIERSHKPRYSKAAKWSTYSREQVARYYALRCISLGKLLDEEEIEQDSFLPDWYFFERKMQSAFLEDLQECAYDCDVKGFAEIYQPVLDAREVEREKTEAEKAERRRVNAVLMQLLDERQAHIDEIAETALLAYQAEEQEKRRKEKAKKATAKAARKRQFEMQQEAEEQRRLERTRAREAERQYQLEQQRFVEQQAELRRMEQQRQAAQEAAKRRMAQEVEQKRQAFEAAQRAARQRQATQQQTQKEPDWNFKSPFGAMFKGIANLLSEIFDI